MAAWPFRQLWIKYFARHWFSVGRSVRETDAGPFDAKPQAGPSAKSGLGQRRPGVWPWARATGLLGVPDLVDVDRVFHGAGLHPHYLRWFPALDGKLVRNHARPRLEPMFKIGPQTLVGAGQEVHGDYVGGAQIHMQGVAF